MKSKNFFWVGAQLDAKFSMISNDFYGNFEEAGKFFGRAQLGDFFEI